MDPKKDPPWHFWKWFQHHRNGKDKSTQSEVASLSSDTNVHLHPVASQTALPQSDKDNRTTTREAQSISGGNDNKLPPQRNSNKKSTQPDQQKLTEFFSAAPARKTQKLSLDNSLFDEDFPEDNLSSSSSSSLSSIESVSPQEEDDNDDGIDNDPAEDHVRDIRPPGPTNLPPPPMSAHVQNQKSIRRKTPFPTFKLKLPKSRHSIPGGPETMDFSKKHSLKGHNKGPLNKIRSLRSLNKIYPTFDDDKELMDDEVTLMAWASKVHVSSVSVSSASDIKNKFITKSASQGKIHKKLSTPGLNELQISRQTRETLEEGIQRVDVLIDETNHRPNLFADVDAYRSDPSYAPFGFIIICALLILWGLLCICQALILLLYIPASEYLLNYDDQTVQKLPLYFLITAGVYAFIAGVVGILALIKDYPIFYSFISHTSFVILALLFASSLVASESWAAPTNSTYYRIWESEILRKDFPSLAQGSYTDLKLNITDDLQQEIKCCGMQNASEWLYTPKQQIPMSCCAEKSRICKKQLTSWNDTMASQPFEVKMIHFKEITQALYTEPCLVSLQKERSNLIMGYRIYPIIYLLFYFVIMIKLDYLILVIQREYSSWEGISRMYSFRITDTKMYRTKLKQAFCSLFPLCKRRKRDNLSSSSLSKKVSEGHSEDFEELKLPNKKRTMYRMSYFVNSSKKSEKRQPKSPQVQEIKDTSIENQAEQIHKTDDSRKPQVEESFNDAQGKKDDKLTGIDYHLKPKTHWSYKATK